MAGAFSLPTNDFLNHEDLEESGGLSVDSRSAFELILDSFLPRRREFEVRGRNGSIASTKYSWLSAWTEVGRLRGSHIRHLVTKLLRPTGHCGGRNIVSIECGAIWSPVSRSCRSRQFDVP